MTNPIVLHDKRTSKEVRLRRGQQHNIDSEADADIYSYTGGRPEDTFVSSLGEKEEHSFVGLVTAPKLSNNQDFSDDWKTALSEYLHKLEGFAYSRQFEGYTLEDTHRDRTMDICISELNWEIEAGSPYQLSYELTLQTGVGAMPDDPISYGSSTPGGGWTLDGNDLGNFEYISGVRSPQTKVQVRAFAGGPEENDIITESAAERVFNFRGTYPGSNTEQNIFDDTMESLIKNETVTFSTDFPGYNIDGIVISYSSERQSSFGEGSMMKYEFDFHQGEIA